MLLGQPLQLVILVFTDCRLFGVEFTLFGGMLVVSATVTKLVVLVFADCRLFGIEFTLFGGMLVVGATVTTSYSGFH